MSNKMLQELERLNVTLGAIKDSLSEAGSDVEIEDAMDDLEDNVLSFNTFLKAEGGDRTSIDRLVRLNRELTVQLDAVRGIVAKEPEQKEPVKPQFVPIVT